MQIRILKDVAFHNWAVDEELPNSSLLKAAAEIEEGLVDARLGGYLIKKRIATEGRGKRSGYRTLLGHRQGSRLIFLHGFAKNEQDNITKREKAALNKLCDIYMSASDTDLDAMIEADKLLEVKGNEPDT